MRLDRDAINAAKERLSIPDLWRLLNLPGKPRPSGPSPFRQDNHASFSIFKGGYLAKDHSTGQIFDGPAFLAEARGLRAGDALREFVRLAEGGIWANVTNRQETNGYECPAQPDLSKLCDASESDLAAIAQDRGLELAAPKRAHELGTLKTGRICGFPSWVVTDPSGLVAEGRRFKRRLYPAYESLPQRKAHTLRGSVKRWPIGLGVDKKLIEKAAMIAITEGGPDYLANWHFVLRAGRNDILPVSLLGRAIHGLLPEALSLLADKRIKFFPHVDNDGHGLEMVEMVGGQLSGFGCELTYFDFAGLRQANGTPVKDLNDLISLDQGQAEEISGLYE